MNFLGGQKGNRDIVDDEMVNEMSEIHVKQGLWRSSLHASILCVCVDRACDDENAILKMTHDEIQDMTSQKIVNIVLRVRLTKKESDKFGLAVPLSYTLCVCGSSVQDMKIVVIIWLMIATQETCLLYCALSLTRMSSINSESLTGVPGCWTTIHRVCVQAYAEQCQRRMGICGRFSERSREIWREIISMWGSRH